MKDIYFSKFIDNDYKQGSMRNVKILILVGILILTMALINYINLATSRASIRSREVGLSKVNGADTFWIMCILLGEYLQLILIAFILAMPLVYYYMLKWLNSFAYGISIRWWIFLTAGILVTLVAILTVSYQSWKVARLNPVDSLRYE